MELECSTCGTIVVGYCPWLAEGEAPITAPIATRATARTCTGDFDLGVIYRPHTILAEHAGSNDQSNVTRIRLGRLARRHRLPMVGVKPCDSNLHLPSRSDAACSMSGQQQHLDRGFLIATHDRLRSNGFPIIGVISAPTALEGKVSLSQWCLNNNRPQSSPRPQAHHL